MQGADIAGTQTVGPLLTLYPRQLIGSTGNFHGDIGTRVDGTANHHAGISFFDAEEAISCDGVQGQQKRGFCAHHTQRQRRRAPAGVASCIDGDGPEVVCPDRKRGNRANGPVRGACGKLDLAHCGERTVGGLGQQLDQASCNRCATEGGRGVGGHAIADDTGVIGKAGDHRRHWRSGVHRQRQRCGGAGIVLYVNGLDTQTVTAICQIRQVDRPRAAGAGKTAGKQSLGGSVPFVDVDSGQGFRRARQPHFTTAGHAVVGRRADHGRRGST